MSYNWKYNDNVYDIESLKNIFTDAQWYPAQNKLIVSVLDDDHIIDTNKNGTFTDQAQAVLINQIKHVNPGLANTNIIIENLNRIIDYTTWQHNLNHPDNTNQSPQYSMQGFAHRLGVANVDSIGDQGYETEINSGVNKQGQWTNIWQNQWFNNMNDYNKSLVSPDGIAFRPFAQYYPIKDTDTMLLKGLSTKQRPGLHLGYNSTNYDMTMLARLLDSVDNSVYDQVYDNQVQHDPDKLDPLLPTASELRQTNDTLFSRDYINNMWKYASFSKGYGLWIIRNGWLLTNRFIDVSRLNEHQRKVSLKRISGMKGLQIKESDKLSDDTDTINSLTDLAELMAYNVSDVINTKLLFEDPIYQDGYQLKQSLLHTYPETVYQKKADTHRTPDVDPTRIRTNRLRADSSSAQFIAAVIAPYEKIDDMPAIDLDYPSTYKLKELHEKQARGEISSAIQLPDKPFNVLEDTKDWVYGAGRYQGQGAQMGPNGKKQFKIIYQMYKAFEGKNLNNQLSTIRKRNPLKHGYDYAFRVMQDWNHNPMHLDKYAEIPKDADAHQIMAQYGGNVFYMDGNDQPTSCIANLSYGGLHGQEVKLADYQQAKRDNGQFLQHQAEIVNHYGNLIDTYQHRKESYTCDDGTIVKIKDLFMSKSTQKKPVLKTPVLKELFKVDPNSGLSKLRKEYTYVSTNQASHEDFSSYYPTLLTMLGVFRDDKTGLDPYADLYHERLALKAKLKKLTPGSAEYKQVDLEQKLRKLLLNSASGAGDASFDSNIKMNNKTVSMRIIGQLFAWRIGQAEANTGGSVVSSNTDGLYVMNLDPKVNDKVLAKTVAPMLVNIDPEIVHMFVSKDANNRVEVVENPDKSHRINEAKGGTLNSWEGPTPANNLSHPAINDAVLAHYLAQVDNPCSQAFNQKQATDIWYQLVPESQPDVNKRVVTLKMLQWVIASGLSTHRHVFIQQSQDGELTNRLIVPRTNRFFLVKTTPHQIVNTPMIVTKQKVSPAMRRKNKAAGLDVVTGQQSDDDAKLMAKYVNDAIMNQFYWNQQMIKTQKVTQMPTQQNTIRLNQALSLVSNAEYQKLVAQLDVTAYLKMVETTFNNSWKN